MDVKINILMILLAVPVFGQEFLTNWPGGVTPGTDTFSYTYEASLQTGNPRSGWTQVPLTNFDVYSINTLVDTTEVCRTWNVGGEMEVTKIGGYTNIWDGVWPVAKPMMRAAYDRVSLIATPIMAGVIEPMRDEATNMVTSTALVLTNLPKSNPQPTNSTVGFFGTNVWVSGVTGTNGWDVSAYAGREYRSWYLRISEWCRVGTTWMVHILVGLYFLWSIYDMCQKWMSTKVGSHSFATSSYVGISANWAAILVFWVVMSGFFLANLAMHATYYGIYYGATIATHGAAVTHFKSVLTTTDIHGSIAATSQALTGLNGYQSTGSVLGCVGLFIRFLWDFVDVMALLLGGVAVLIFRVVREWVYSMATNIAAAIAGAL